MLSMFGGPAPIDLEKHPTKGSNGVFSLFLAEARVPPGKNNSIMIEGMRARVEITGRSTTPARKLWRWILSLWSV